MKTREKIINAAVEFFSEKGYHDTKMADITEKAGVAKGTAYYNFSSKAILFAEIIEEGIEMILKNVKKNVQKQTTSAEKLQKLIECTINIYLKYDKLFLILVNEINSSIDEEAKDHIFKAREKYLNYVVNILNLGIEKEEYKEEEKKIIAGTLIGAIDGGIITYLHLNNEDINKEELMELILNFMQNGVI